MMQKTLEAKPPRKHTKLVRTKPFEIDEFLGEPQEVRRRWSISAREIQRALNRFWDQWSRWHDAHRHAVKMLEYLNLIDAWRRANPKTRGNAPKCPIQIMPQELYNRLESEMQSYANCCHGRSIHLAIRKEWSGKSKLKVENSSDWVSQRIVAGLGGKPSYRFGQPIPFDLSNAELPSLVEGKWQISVRVSRIEAGSPKSFKDTIVLKTRGKHLANHRAILEDLASGRRRYCGSAVHFKRGKGHWVLLLSYRNPRHPVVDLDFDRIAVLKAGRKSPWRIRARPEGDRPRWSFRVGGPCRNLEHVRRNVARQAGTRSAAFKLRNRKGKGRRKARQIRWRNLLANAKKGLNDFSANWVVEWLKRRGIGCLMYRVPSRDADSRFVVTAGANRWDSGWPHYAFELQLKRKCHAAGILLASSFSELKKAQRTMAEEVE